MRIKERTENKINFSIARKSSFPKSIKPMLAVLVEKIPQGKEWLYEIKWDGYRAIAYCKGNQVNLISRNNKSFNDKYYPIINALQKLKLNAVLDGEIVVLTNQGITNFEALQNWRSEADGELFYYIFDLLWFNGYDLMSMPLYKRKEILSEILPKNDSIKISEILNGSATDYFRAAEKIGLEGLLAKNRESFYFPGLRGKEWQKIKILKRHEVVIGGYTINENSPKPFSSLLVGVYEKGALHYIGKIGTGFNTKEQKELLQKFKTLLIKKSPFTITPNVNKPSRFRPNPPPSEVFWLSPNLICEVSYAEMTADGIMRHPSFEGMRDDKNPKEVHAEKPKSISTLKKKTQLNITPLKKTERKTLLNPSEETQVKLIKGKKLKFNNLSRVYWPDEEYTKRDLINYYYQIAPYIVPYLKNRPQSLNRFPMGIYGESFYQKDVTKMAPDWIKKFPYHTSDGKDKNYLVLQDEADLLWMANLGAIEMNPWNSTIETPDYPDWCIIDIDPTEKNNFEQVIETALTTKKTLDELNIEGYCKTSGATGVHIFIPMGAKYTYEQSQLFGRFIANEVHKKLPKFTSVERQTVKRKGKVYVDFLQNRPKATLAAPYSVRPKPGATVSMPLYWDEVKKGLHPKKFTIKNAFQRVQKEGDIFKPVLGKGINLEKVVQSINTT